jgi:hypothetical protein
MFGYTAFPSIYGPSLTGIAGTARASTRIHGTIYQKAIVFMIAAVRT